MAAIRAALPEVVGVWLFGSHATGRVRPDSDIDLAVLARGPLDPVAVFDLGLELGVLARCDVDLIDLRHAPTVLRKEVTVNGRRVACADSVACDRFAADAVAMYVALPEERRALLPPAAHERRRPRQATEHPRLCAPGARDGSQ